MFASRYVLDEVRRNLTAKFPEGLEFVEEFTESGVLRMTDPPAAEVERIARAVERKDSPVVAAAMVAGAALVTYDRRHLLSQADMIREAFGVEVLTPEEVLRRLEGDA